MFFTWAEGRGASGDPGVHPGKSGSGGSGHPLGAVLGRRHAQSPAFLLVLQKWQLGFGLFYISSIICSVTFMAKGYF